ncbi:hypothetical protein P261_01607 [Lachnospiraceae bacterium TWA4]|nr:hypothetical protein P261_01607 [Lachnospiraceae bacterium TWA4]
MLNFCIGLMASKLPTVKKNFSTIPIVGCIIFFIIACFFEETILWTLGVGMVFCLLVWTLSNTKFPSYWVRFGDQTYTFYLVHYFIVKGWLRIVMKFLPNTITIEIIGFFICFIISLIVGEIYERCRNYCRI